MAVKTPDQFFDLLIKSNALGDARLAKAKELTKGIGNVKDVARQLIKADMLTKWQAAKLLSGKTNLMIGKYRLLGQIGGASTGTVFLAEHTQMNRRVALKALVHRDHSPDSTQKFLKQARAVSSLEHPSLTRAYDIDIQDQYYYLVLEYVQGRSVEDILTKGEKLDPYLVATYIRQAADGLEYAHGKGLLHRDIRPANIMISNDGELKVLNLGVVKLSDPADLPADDSTDASDLEHANYLSPEQARGSDNIDARSDLYSLGCVMFAMLTGTPPFDGRTFGEIVEKHQSAPPKKILDLCPGLSRDLAKICMKLLGRKREDRFQTAAQVVKFLDKWLEANAPPAPVKPPVAAAAAPPVAATPGVKPPATSSKPPLASEPADAPAPESISIAVADAPAPAGGGFSIDADSRGRRVKKKGKAKPAAAAPAPDTEVTRASGSSKTLIIGGAIGGGVLALALVVMLVVFLFTGGDDEVAQVAPEAEQPAAPIEEEPAAAVDPAAAVVEPAANPEVAPTPEVEAAPETPTAVPAAAEPAPDLAALLSQPKPAPAQPEPAAEAPPAEDPPAENPPAEEPPQEPAPAATPDSEPAEAQPEAAPAEAAPANGKQPKRTPQQAKEPLKELVARVALPTLAKARGDQPAEGVGATVSLGKVFDVDDEPVFVDLLGADQIKRGTVEFKVEREHASPVDNRKWTIILTSERPGEENRKIAEFVLQDFNLQFTWLEASLDALTDANALRNCMLLVTLGKDQEKAVALRTPQAIEPMSISLTGKAARGQAEVDNLPAKEDLKVKITKVEGFPPNTSLPPTPFPADGGSAMIAVGEPGQEPLQFVIKATVSGKKPTLMASPMFKLTGMNEAEVASPAKLAEIYSSVLRVQQGANEFLKKNNPPQEQARAEKVLADADAAFQQLNTIKSVADSMAESGKIHYELVYTVGTHEMVLASSEAQ